MTTIKQALKEVVDLVSQPAPGGDRPMIEHEALLRQQQRKALAFINAHAPELLALLDDGMRLPVLPEGCVYCEMIFQECDDPDQQWQVSIYDHVASVQSLGSSPKIAAEKAIEKIGGNG